MAQVFAIAIFGALGCLLRFGLAYRIKVWFPHAFPVGTLCVNVLGCFLIGLLATLFIEKAVLSDTWRAGILIGFLGGFTTFSSFSWDAWDLFLNGYLLNGFLYIFASVVLCLLATFIGMYLVKVIM